MPIFVSNMYEKCQLNATLIYKSLSSNMNHLAIYIYFSIISAFETYAVWLSVVFDRIMLAPANDPMTEDDIYIYIYIYIYNVIYIFDSFFVHMRIAPGKPEIAMASYERHDNSNYRYLDCLFTRLFREIRKKTSKLRIIGQWWISLIKSP